LISRPDRIIMTDDAETVRGCVEHADAAMADAGR
jgi:hypothetical protein